ncbi:hypothetical protein [Rhizobium leguminosarum]|uniref:hypothetical protein n=1 Tax=Rhizobium leguminosarum TaxID=384 RepID=UPI001F4593C0|nr:hypothetical protein [Rhizobium leguminosarum]UIJ81814.1 hypothetical protein LZK78_11270 [Rhizobium leguminosarum]
MTTDFIAELIRAANQIEKVTRTDVRRMLHRAIVSIRDLRESLGIPGSGTSRDDVIPLFDAATDADALAASELSAALLKSANMLRALHIAADSGTHVWIRSQEPIA